MFILKSFFVQYFKMLIQKVFYIIIKLFNIDILNVYTKKFFCIKLKNANIKKFFIHY